MKPGMLQTRGHIARLGCRAWRGYGSQQLKETRARYIPGRSRSRKPHSNARANLVTSGRAASWQRQSGRVLAR